MSPKAKEDNGGSVTKLSMEITHIKSLIDLMVENDLSRLELREGESHILLRRGQPVLTSASPPVVNTPPLAAGVSNPRSVAPDTPTHAVTETEESDEVLIRSPMVGTFYTAADPDSPPFVSVGSVVEPDTVICLIEAMKVFNELKAEVAGQITRVLVNNAQAVEFDQPLFAVTPT